MGKNKITERPVRLSIPYSIRSETLSRGIDGKIHHNAPSFTTLSMCKFSVVPLYLSAIVLPFKLLSH